MNQLENLSLRQAVQLIENEMRKQPQLTLNTVHYFSDGVYAREIFIPAGVVLTGKIHKRQQINILSKGRILVLTENGLVDVEAPFTVVSPPGTKRIARAITDCVWTTILPTNEKNPDVIEDQFTCSTEEEYLKFCNQIENAECLSLLQR